jgi:hypothetical protein
MHDMHGVFMPHAQLYVRNISAPFWLTTPLPCSIIKASTCEESHV